ncbi:uncharacterized protein [Macrobrachium rosenbergii]|uniref:uncharacterized protein n=1 Tax=Macrobrachium rosenbergii TaxID=79674 RepID=UPI0034D41AA0
MTLAESKDYEIVKEIILKVYELTPEYYREKFRRYRKMDSESYVEYSHKVVKYHNKWIKAASVTNMEEYSELVLLEQFMKGIPYDVQTYLFEREVSTVQRAASLAENYSLLKPSHYRFRQSKRPPGTGKSSADNNDSSGGSNSNGLPGFTCFACGKHGHIKRNCPNKSKDGHVVTRKATMVMGEIQSLKEGILQDDIQGEFASFMFDGVVSLSDDLAGISVRIMRDTGSSHSLVVKGKIPRIEEHFTGEKMVIQSLGGIVTIPLCRLHLSCDLFTKYVVVGVVESLPVKGVEFLMGNDLAGKLVVPDPIVVDIPLVECPTLKLEKENPTLFPSCVVKDTLERYQRTKVQW